jgi:hypothetical protein
MGNLRKKADKFLRACNPTCANPVSLEKIVEIEFSIKVLPVYRLPCR